MAQTESKYLSTKNYLKLETTPEQDFCCLLLEADGLRFCIDFGYENAVSMAKAKHPVMFNRFLRDRFTNAK